MRPESELDFGTGPNGSTPAVCYRDVLRAMKKEVAIMDSLGANTHVVNILGTAEDCRVFVMERAVSDLYTIVKQQDNRLPLGHAKLWAGHMVQAIEFIHSMGVVHQDIKSSNILVFPDRVAKLCDFGLAKKGAEVMVVDRELITLWYRAPEIIMGDDTYTSKVDEWGIGCVLLEMMIGVPPFKGKPECTCSCSDITHRNFNSDQLMKIFLCLGTPAKESTLACAAHFNRWPHFPRKLETMLQRVITPERLASTKDEAPSPAEHKQAVEEWTSLIDSMLQLNPRERHTAKRILETPFFAGSHVKRCLSSDSATSSMATPATSPTNKASGSNDFPRASSTESTESALGSPSDAFTRRCSMPAAVVHQRLSPTAAARKATLGRPKSSAASRGSTDTEAMPNRREDARSRAAAVAAHSKKAQSFEVDERTDRSQYKPRHLQVGGGLVDAMSDKQPRDPVSTPKSTNILSAIKRRVDSFIRTGTVVLPAVDAPTTPPKTPKETAGAALRRKSIEQHHHFGSVLPRADAVTRAAPIPVRFADKGKTARIITSPMLISRRASDAGGIKGNAPKAVTDHENFSRSKSVGDPYDRLG